MILRRAPRLPLAVIALLAAPVLVAAPALARSQTDLPWPPKDVFSIAVRFIRIERGCRITDKDGEAGFILFECDADGDSSEGGGKNRKPPKRGALELIPLEVQGRGGVRAQLTLHDEPNYIEARFLELLERKIKEERGPVLPVRPPPPPVPAPDAGR